MHSAAQDEKQRQIGHPVCQGCRHTQNRAENIGPGDYLALGARPPDKILGAEVAGHHREAQQRDEQGQQRQAFHPIGKVVYDGGIAPGHKDLSHQSADDDQSQILVGFHGAKQFAPLDLLPLGLLGGGVIAGGLDIFPGHNAGQ